MTKVRCSVARDYPEACQKLGQLLAAENPANDPDLLDSYQIEAVPNHDATTGKRDGSTLTAWPKGKRPDAKNVFAVIYGCAAMAHTMGWRR